MGKKWTIKPKSLELDKIYLTRDGYERMRSRYHDLLYNQRPVITKEVGIAAAHGDRSENAEYIYGKRKLRQIDREVYVLQKKLEKVVIVEDKDFPKDHVGFGSKVRLKEEDGNEKVIQIVGEEEIDLAQGKISYKSPLAKALWKKKVGEICLFNPPKGEVEYQIMEIF